MNWVEEIETMHYKFGVHDWVDAKIEEKDHESLIKYLEFRIKFLEEELNETKKALEDKNPEEIVDGLIDLCVIAIGTLDAFKVNADLAWAEVFYANMKKKVGVKESRPNPLGLPDLIKDPSWTPPDHTDNHGILSDIL